VSLDRYAVAQRMTSVERDIEDHELRLRALESAIQQMRGARNLLVAVLGTSILSSVLATIGLLVALH
jgi:hypothetical protein